MIGAVAGDVIGSQFERKPIKTKHFELFTDKCTFTDDSVMTIAVGAALLTGDLEHLAEKTIQSMRALGRCYPNAGYGARFYSWLQEKRPSPYRSWGNGAAMRVSACGYAARTLAEAELLAEIVTAVTHNHREGIRGAKATSAAVFMARSGYSRDEIKIYIDKKYYPLDFSLSRVRQDYRFDISCKGTVPYAIVSFLESDSYEDAVRNAISLGGDSDTLGAITGGIAEAFYGVPYGIREKAETYLDKRLKDMLHAFEYQYGPRPEEK